MNNRFSFASVCAYASFAMSLTMLILWACNVGGFSVVSLDSFVGVIVGLLAIIVTVAIGWQIFNIIEMNRKIEQLDERLKEVQEIKAQLKEQQKKIENQGHEACHFNHVGLAHFFFSNKDYLGAFRFYQSALRHSLYMDSHINLIPMVESMDKAIVATPSSHKLQFSLYEEVESIDKEIRESKLFKLIQNQYERAYALFKQKVVREP